MDRIKIILGGEVLFKEVMILRRVDGVGYFVVEDGFWFGSLCLVGKCCWIV